MACDLHPIHTHTHTHHGHDSKYRVLMFFFFELPERPQQKACAKQPKMSALLLLLLMHINRRSCRIFITIIIKIKIISLISRVIKLNQYLLDDGYYLHTVLQAHNVHIYIYKKNPKQV